MANSVADLIRAARNGVSAPSADDLAQRVRTTLASPDKEQARSAIAGLLAVFAHE